MHTFPRRTALLACLALLITMLSGVTAIERRFYLRAASHNDGSISPIALLEHTPPVLSPAEAAIVEQALDRLALTCESDMNAMVMLLSFAPARALPHLDAAYRKGDAAAKARLISLVASRSETEAVTVVLKGLLDQEFVTVNGQGTFLQFYTKSVLAAAKKPVPIVALLRLCADAKPDTILQALKQVDTAGIADAIMLMRLYARHADGGVRAKAVACLALAGADMAAGDLRDALSDHDARVRQAVLHGLDKMGVLTPDDVLAALAGADETVFAAACEVMPAATSAVLHEQVLERVASPKPVLRAAAATALGRFGIAADLPLLLNGLQKDKDKNVRAAAARALGGHPALADVSPLLAVASGVSEKNVDVRRAAAEGLASASLQGIREAIVRLQPNDEQGVWNTFAAALCRRQSPLPEALLAVAKLLPSYAADWETLANRCSTLPPADCDALSALVLERGSGMAQAAVIRRLIAEPTPAAKRVLLAACDAANVLPEKNISRGYPEIRQVSSGMWSVRENYQQADIFSLLQNAVKSAFPEEWDDARARLVKNAVKQLDSAAATDVRCGAVRALGRYDPVAHADLLVKATEDTDSAVRAEAVAMLAHLPPAQVMPALVRLADDASSSVVEAVAKVVAELGGAELRPLAFRLLQDKREYIRTAAVACVSKYPDDAAQCVDFVVDTAGYQDQQEVVAACAQLSPAQATTALGSLATKAKHDSLSTQTIAKLVELASTDRIAFANAEQVLMDIVNGPSKYRSFLALCAMESLMIHPKRLDALLSAQPPKNALAPFELGALYSFIDTDTVLSAVAGDPRAGEINPRMTNLVVFYRFHSGEKQEYVGNYIYTTTYYASLTLATPRREDRFDAGDRWPLDRKYSVYADPIVLACARYADPRADACISNAAKSKNQLLRRSAVWALTLRDDRVAVEAFLRDKSKDVANEAIRALRLLGHRTSITILAPYVKNSTEAALAVVEIGLGSYEDSEVPQREEVQ